MALGLGRLNILQPAEPVRLYQWPMPGVMIHLDKKWIPSFEAVGHRNTVERRLAFSPQIFDHKANVAMDDDTRWPTSSCCRTRSKSRPLVCCCQPWPVLMVMALPASGCSRITAAPTALGHGGKLAQLYTLRPGELGSTPQEPKAKRRDSSRPAGLMGLLNSPPDLSQTEPVVTAASVYL
jgi:hypothetical protein